MHVYMLVYAIWLKIMGHSEKFSKNMFFLRHVDSNVKL